MDEDATPQQILDELAAVRQQIATYVDEIQRLHALEMQLVGRFQLLDELLAAPPAVPPG